LIVTLLVFNFSFWLYIARRKRKGKKRRKSWWRYCYKNKMYSIIYVPFTSMVMGLTSVLPNGGPPISRVQNQPDYTSHNKQGLEPARLHMP
jgi:amino acid transporter